MYFLKVSSLFTSLVLLQLQETMILTDKTHIVQETFLPNKYLPCKYYLTKLYKQFHRASPYTYGHII